MILIKMLLVLAMIVAVFNILRQLYPKTTIRKFSSLFSESAPRMEVAITTAPESKACFLLNDTIDLVWTYKKWYTRRGYHESIDVRNHGNGARIIAVFFNERLIVCKFSPSRFFLCKWHYCQHHFGACEYSPVAKRMREIVLPPVEAAELQIARVRSELQIP